MVDKMINAMMKHYQLFAWMGFGIVILAFIFSLSGSGANASFFSADKVTREAASSGTTLALANAARHVVSTWVPSFKFLGLGIMLGAIVMALGTVSLTLRTLGKHVAGIWPEHLNPGVPEKPRSVRVFQLFMMMGIMILIIGFIWALVLTGTVSSYWNNSVAEVLNPAQAGSALLNQLATISATLPWLAFLRFLGMTSLFTASTIALTIIIRTLQQQEKVLTNFVKKQQTN